MQALCVGVDVSQETYRVLIEDWDSKQLGLEDFENSQQGAQALVAWVLERRPDDKTPVLVATEGLRGWVSPLDRRLAIEPGICYVPLCSKAVDEHRCHFPEDVTDTTDAAVIADLLRTQVAKGKARVFEGWNEEEEDLRICARTFQSVNERKNRNMNTLRALCEQHVPDYLRDKRLPDLDQTSLLGILAWCPDPAELAKQPVEEIAQVLRKASRGHHGQELAQTFQEVAGAMGVTLSSTIQLCIRAHVTNVLRDEEQIKDLERHMKALLEQLPYAEEILKWRGVGVRTLGCFLGEAGDLSRFENEGNLARMSGVTPVRDQSGKRDRQKKGRRFNRRMKRALILMAQCRVQFDKESADYYHKKRQENYNHFRALKGLARFLLRRIYSTCLSWQENHDPALEKT